MKLLLALLLTLVICPTVNAQNLLPAPPVFEEKDFEYEETEDEFEEEIDVDITINDNPFSGADDFNKIVGKKITEDVWEELKGELPCAEATTECTRQIQQLAVDNNFAIKEIQERIDEVNEKIDEARANNKKSILWDQINPLIQYYFTTDGTFSEVDRTFQQVFNQEFQQIELVEVPPPPSPLQRLLGDIFNPVRLVNNALALVGIPILENIFGGGSQQAQTRAIAIGDLQVKIAQLQRDLTELKESVREKVALELIELDNLNREFQISQAIARKDEQRLKIIKIAYRFGEYDTESYIARIASFDRVSADVWRNWTKLKTQLVKLQQMTSDEED